VSRELNGDMTKQIQKEEESPTEEEEGFQVEVGVEVLEGALILKDLLLQSKEKIPTMMRMKLIRLSSASKFKR